MTHQEILDALKAIDERDRAGDEQRRKARHADRQALQAECEKAGHIYGDHPMMFGMVGETKTRFCVICVAREPRQ